MRRTLLKYYHRLRARFGHRSWWPGETRIEIIVGAILTQNTAWKNVTLALDNLKRERILSVPGLRSVSETRLAQLIRSSGYFNQKARHVKEFIRFLDEHYGGSLARMARAETSVLRRQLLSVRGIGPETADSILCYAFDRPVFVIDAYTKRVLVRHQLTAENATYAELQELMMANLPADAALFNDYHAQFVAVGHLYCKPKPQCESCPLREFLP
ncbi:endonuclease III domain-containing protein [bacterium]|nr:endonuclease III domain-containing protein [bacterium]